MRLALCDVIKLEQKLRQLTDARNVPVQHETHSVMAERTTHLLDLATELLPLLLTGLTHTELARAGQSCRALRRAVSDVRAACRSADLPTLGISEHRRSLVVMFSEEDDASVSRLRQTSGCDASWAGCPPTHDILSGLVGGLTGLQRLCLRGLRGVDDAAVVSALSPSLPHLRDLDLSLTAVGTRGVLSLRALPRLESLDITYCAMVSYAAVIALRDACPRIKLIRRLPQWLEGQYDTPWGEVHTYYPCGAFRFTRAAEAVGFVAQLRQHGGSAALPQLASCAHKVDDADGQVTTHVEDRLVYVDLDLEYRNGDVGVCVTPRGANQVLVVQSTVKLQPPRRAHPAIMSGYGLPEEGETIQFGPTVLGEPTMVSCMPVRPLEPDTTAPPADVQVALRNYFSSGRKNAEISAFLSCHRDDLFERKDKERGDQEWGNMLAEELFAKARQCFSQDVWDEHGGPVCLPGVALR